MYENLTHETRKARKSHRCDWCNGAIEKGESYEYQTYIWDGHIYDWKSHEACSRVVSAIWDYADPDDGMDSDSFYDSCHEVCQKFICPDCPKWDKEIDDCEDEELFCIDKMDEFFKTHELYGTREGYYRVFRCREKKVSK